MKNLSEAAVSKEAIEMSVEEWFDTFGVEIMKREEKRQRMAKLVISLKAKAATAGR
jgi:hypothetical protein